MRWKEKKDELIKLINDKVSYEEIGRKYQVSGAAIKKAAIRLGIILEQRRKINPSETFNKGTARKGICENCGGEFVLYHSSTKRFCSSKCHAEHKHKLRYKEFLKGGEYFQRGNYNPRIFKNDIIKEQDGKCAICGCEQEHNSKPLVFILDHIDGNASNNTRENLRCICPNCDSQLDTYKSKNKNSARNYYRYGKK